MLSLCQALFKIFSKKNKDTTSSRDDALLYQFCPNFALSYGHNRHNTLFINVSEQVL